MLEIPGYPDYRFLTNPGRVLNTRTGYELTGDKNRKGLPCISLRASDGRYHKVTLAKIARLAFHGQQPPRGYVAVHTGGDLTPTTCKWQPVKRAHKYWSRTRRKVTPHDEDRIMQLYMEQGLTQDAIATRYQIAPKTVSRIICGRSKRR